MTSAHCTRSRDGRGKERKGARHHEDLTRSLHFSSIGPSLSVYVIIRLLCNGHFLTFRVIAFFLKSTGSDFSFDTKFIILS